MSLLTGVLAAGRAQAEARFTETFTVFCVTNVLDESTGIETPTEVTVYASMAGRYVSPTLTVLERAQGAQVPAVQDVHVHVAVGSTPDVQVGHVWRCTASTVDAGLVGREVRTKGTPQMGQVTAWRYPVESVV